MATVSSLSKQLCSARGVQVLSAVEQSVQCYARFPIRVSGLPGLPVRRPLSSKAANVLHGTSFLGGSRPKAGPSDGIMRCGGVARLQMVAGTAVDTKEYVQQLKGAKEAVRELVTSKKSNPILVRLGWHDAGTYDKELGLENWPRCGGANGSMRFKPEQSHNANAGLANAVLLLEDIKKQFPKVSHADLYQLASAVAVEVAGGPTIPLKFGRVDAAEKDDCVVDGKLPSGDPESTHKQSPADHLRKVFYRMGLNDQEIVVLSGAHTLGRVYPDRSGFGKASTKYTKNGPGTKGGSSWTPEWLKFDNSYFKEVKARTDPELVVLSTDGVLFQDEKFREYAEKYAEDQDLFFKDYVLAHKKLSELGAKFDPPEGVSLST